MRTLEELLEIESSQRQHHEMIQHDIKLQTVMERLEYNLFAMLKPKVHIDGDQYCVLLGDNIQEGVCGFGETIYKAILDFNKSFNNPISSGR